MQDGHTITYASKALTTERNYAQTEKECLVIASACTKFDQNIYIWQNHGYNIYRSQTSGNSIQENITGST